MVTFNLWGAHPNLGLEGSTLPRGGICLNNFTEARKQKLLPGVGLPGNFFSCGLITNLGSQGPPFQEGVFALIILQGQENKSWFMGWVCLGQIILWRAHPKPGRTGSTPPNGGIRFENRVGASKQKLLFGVGLPWKNSVMGAHPKPGPTGSNHS